MIDNNIANQNNTLPEENSITKKKRYGLIFIICPIVALIIMTILFDIFGLGEVEKNTVQIAIVKYIFGFLGIISVVMIIIGVIMKIKQLFKKRS